MASPSPCNDAKQLPQTSASFLRCLGFEGSRRNNLCYIAPNTLIHICGNSVQFLDLKTMSQISLPSIGGGGVGSIAVHPSKEYFAVCEKGSHPNVYVYSYPSLIYHKVLKLGTERLYTAAAFNHDGSQLATVGGYPDYWLTVWDWMNETIVLQSKAFSQEIFKVSFSRYFSGQLTTAGIGHIRFWKMATTFTGLKLEGLIGKFGQVPLSDISGYMELADGKVLSGTETGTIIVWDGGLIKCQLKRPGGLPCHDGMIEILQFDDKENEMITAGADGCVRFWSLEWLDAADDGDEKTVCEVNPLRELQVDESCSIKGIIISDDHWLIQDENGSLWKVYTSSFRIEKVFEFHAGPITGLAMSPSKQYLATSGLDCSVRLFHFNESKQVYARWFTAGATAIFWPPKSVNPHDGSDSLAIYRGWRAISNFISGCNSFLLPRIQSIQTTREEKSSLGDQRSTGNVKSRSESGKQVNDIEKMECELHETETEPSMNLAEENKDKVAQNDCAFDSQTSQAYVQEMGENFMRESYSEDNTNHKEEQEGCEGIAHSRDQNTLQQEDSKHVTTGDIDQDSMFGVRALLYTNSNLNTFYVALESSAAGFLFECHIDMKGVMGVIRWHSVPVKILGSRRWRYSDSNSSHPRAADSYAAACLLGG